MSLFLPEGGGGQRGLAPVGDACIEGLRGVGDLDAWVLFVGVYKCGASEEQSTDAPLAPNHACSGNRSSLRPRTHQVAIRTDRPRRHAVLPEEGRRVRAVKPRVNRPIVPRPCC